MNLYDLEDRDLFYHEIEDSHISPMHPGGNEAYGSGELIENPEVFRSDLTVSDVVYNPRETRLLSDAAAAGCKVIPGIGMLLWQGAEAFKLLYR